MYRTSRFASIEALIRWRNRTPAKVRQIPTEEQEQIAFFDWVRSQTEYPALAKLLHHVPNGGYRKPSEAVRFARAGVLPGVPDICLPIARRGAHSLYLELKALDGHPSALQIARAVAFAEEGNIVAFVWGAKEAQEVLLWYLS